MDSQLHLNPIRVQSERSLCRQKASSSTVLLIFSVSLTRQEQRRRDGWVHQTGGDTKGEVRLLTWNCYNKPAASRAWLDGPRWPRSLRHPHTSCFCRVAFTQAVSLMPLTSPAWWTKHCPGEIKMPWVSTCGLTVQIISSSHLFHRVLSFQYKSSLDWSVVSSGVFFSSLISHAMHSKFRIHFCIHTLLGGRIQ